MADFKKMFPNKKIFEAFVTSVLRQKAADQGVIIYFDAPIDADANSGASTVKHYDAIAPDGFDSYNGPVIFEFKHSNQAQATSLGIDQLINSISFLNEKQKTLKEYPQNTTLIIVSSCHYTNIDVNELWYVHNISVCVWDGSVVEQWCKEYPVNYSNAIGIEKLTSKFFDTGINDSDFL